MAAISRALPGRFGVFATLPTIMNLDRVSKNLSRPARAFFITFREYSTNFG